MSKHAVAAAAGPALVSTRSSRTVHSGVAKHNPAASSASPAAEGNTTAPTLVSNRILVCRSCGADLPDDVIQFRKHLRSECPTFIKERQKPPVLAPKLAAFLRPDQETLFRQKFRFFCDLCPPNFSSGDRFKGCFGDIYCITRHEWRAHRIYKDGLPWSHVSYHAAKTDSPLKKSKKGKKRELSPYAQQQTRSSAKRAAVAAGPGVRKDAGETNKGKVRAARERRHSATFDHTPSAAKAAAIAALLPPGKREYDPASPSWDLRWIPFDPNDDAGGDDKLESGDEGSHDSGDEESAVAARVIRQREWEQKQKAKVNPIVAAPQVEGDSSDSDYDNPYNLPDKLSDTSEDDDEDHARTLVSWMPLQKLTLALQAIVQPQLLSQFQQPPLLPPLLLPVAAGAQIGATAACRCRPPSLFCRTASCLGLAQPQQEQAPECDRGRARQSEQPIKAQQMATM
ncbi:hypothetical protein HDU88_004385 [Geranomyces variabilis]|nr:hypothetical protein HDU88_004385 [Geranomyces variabilis]